MNPRETLKQIVNVKPGTRMKGGQLIKAFEKTGAHVEPLSSGQARGQLDSSHARVSVEDQNGERVEFRIPSVGHVTVDREIQRAANILLKAREP